MRQWLTIGGLAAAFCLALGPAQAQGIGMVELVDVWAYGTPPGSARQDRFVRDAVVQQELLETVQNGSMHVRFADGTELRLGSASQATLDSFVYNGSPGTGEMTANLTRGAFRFISGQVNKSGVRLRTPTALIGIRGTDFIVNVVAATGATVISVISGIVTVQSVAGGPASAVDVAAGQSVSVAPNASAAAPATPNVMDPGLNAPAPGPAGPGTGATGADGGGEAQGSEGSPSD